MLAAMAAVTILISGIVPPFTRIEGDQVTCNTRCVVTLKDGTEQAFDAGTWTVAGAVAVKPAS